MYFIFKLTVVLLILYLKLNGLNTTPLIDRHKAAIGGLDNAPGAKAPAALHSSTHASSSTTHTALPPVLPSAAETENGSSNYINNKASHFVDNANSSDNNFSNNNDSNNAVDGAGAGGGLVATHFNNQYKSFSPSAHEKAKGTAVIGPPNQTTTDSKSVASKSTYFYYKVVDGASEANQQVTPEITNTTKATGSPLPNASEPTADNGTDRGDEAQQELNDSDVERFLLKYDSDGGNTCFLDGIKNVLLWWTFANGSLREANFNKTVPTTYLDLSFQNSAQDNTLFWKAKKSTMFKAINIIVFSAAHNNLTRAPYRTLSCMSKTLKYLTLRGNQFAAMQKDAINRIVNDTNRHADSEHNETEESGAYESLLSQCHSQRHSCPHNDTRSHNRNTGYETSHGGGIAWATFPLLPSLIELDISNCHIEYVGKNAFMNLTSLKRLYLSYNKMFSIPSDTFQFIPSLQLLDLSFTKVLDYDYPLSYPTVEAIFSLFYGVKIHQTTFKFLPHLVYLDLSHTKLTRNSAMAFTHLSDKLKYLSLCYTAFPMVGNALFKNTALVGLDLSGNAYAANNIIDDAFEGISDTLRYLYFEYSNIKDLGWIKYLENLRILALAGNNINMVNVSTFRRLHNLQVLDLSSNHVGNWYNRAFTHNQQLRVLNMRDNNINIVTSEMLRDFELLDYLGLGENNFVCDCLLRDLMDVAAANNKDANCSRNVLQNAQNIYNNNVDLVGEYISPNVTKLAGHLLARAMNHTNFELDLDYLDLSQAAMQRYAGMLERSYKNIKRYGLAQGKLKMRFVANFFAALRAEPSTQCPDPDPIYVHDKLNSSSLKFQLLDYEDDHYWCFNETERLPFLQLNCQPRGFVEDKIAKKLNTLTKYVIGCVGAFIAVVLLGVIIYLKRWHIHYYYSSLKSAALLSVATKETVDKFNSWAENDPNLVYDIFISYCQSDRQWVLEELLPNVEETGDISICMHERDFQIGLPILDNIMSCMDRSRALMLIISKHFLLSHWCQFEMHLAQHRIFEVSKEHLILVFLEDIPRSKRPKTLQYLMEVKTYIKWPKEAKPDERKLFWKRMKRSLENVGVNSNESRA